MSQTQEAISPQSSLGIMNLNNPDGVCEAWIVVDEKDVFASISRDSDPTSPVSEPFSAAGYSSVEGVMRVESEEEIRDNQMCSCAIAKLAPHRCVIADMVNVREGRSGESAVWGGGKILFIPHHFPSTVPPPTVL